MNSTLAEVLDAARALPRAERAEIAHELLSSLDASSDTNEARYAALKEAIALGMGQIERGESIHVPKAERREYIRSLGREAAERVARKSA